MTTIIHPTPSGPGRSFIAAIVQACPDMVPFQVAALFVDEPVGPVHEAFARHLIFGYLASIGDPVTDADRIAGITAKGKEALETVRKCGLEPAAWQALAYVQAVGA